MALFFRGKNNSKDCLDKTQFMHNKAFNEMSGKLKDYYINLAKNSKCYSNIKPLDPSLAIFSTAPIKESTINNLIINVINSGDHKINE